MWEQQVQVRQPVQVLLLVAVPRNMYNIPSNNLLIPSNIQPTLPLQTTNNKINTLLTRNDRACAKATGIAEVITSLRLGILFMRLRG